ncbi:hypothetical protein VNI00_016974 [Paramarasmius palmivorus]|uniref:F-box domain-containing protein n=1 Tax=Paramarasmius palmivorus TaxID=297713 RepID=A0AAW0BA05_9AGAR
MPEAHVQTHIHPIDASNLQTIDMYDMDYEFFSTASFSTGSRLGGVCRRWRDVTLRTPALWASILIEIADSQYFSEASERLELYLERSKATPLSIALQVDELEYAATHVELLELLELLDLVLQNAHRIALVKVSSRLASCPFILELPPRPFAHTYALQFGWHWKRTLVFEGNVTNIKAFDNGAIEVNVPNQPSA